MNDTNKNKIFFITLFTLVFLSATATFVKYVVLHDYTVVREEVVEDEALPEETEVPTE